MNKKRNLMLTAMGLFLFIGNISAQKDIPLHQDTKGNGQESPSVDTVVTASYDDGTITIKSKDIIPVMEVDIRNRHGETIFSHAAPALPKSTTQIDLPQDVDKEKFDIQVKYNGKAFEGKF